MLCVTTEKVLELQDRQLVTELKKQVKTYESYLKEDRINLNKIETMFEENLTTKDTEEIYWISINSCKNLTF